MGSIDIKIENKIARITLNRPDVRNAFNEEMISNMTKTFKSLSNEPDLRAVHLSGNGESFCAGGDLNWMKSMVKFTEAENVKDSELLYEMYEALKNIPVPVVTYVHGHAMGGALGLIAVSDIVFAEQETQFSFSEVGLGLAPSVISAFVKDKILPRDMSRYFLTAEVFKAKEAFEMGLVNGFGNSDEALAMTEKILKKVRNNGPSAVRDTKKLIGHLEISDNVKVLTTELIAKRRVSDEGQEGLAAFFEKRKPSWMES